ncbi:hypothetical protein JCM10212_005784, partial [Sporobolomyces blumeae]
MERDPPLVSPSLPLSTSLSSFSLSAPTDDGSPLVAPRTHPASPRRSTAPSTDSVPSSSRPESSFERLPPELIEQVAFALCRESRRHGPPSELVHLLLVSKRFNDVLGPRNKGFYAGLFKERFDWKGVERRWCL